MGHAAKASVGLSSDPRSSRQSLARLIPFVTLGISLRDSLVDILRGKKCFVYQSGSRHPRPPDALAFWAPVFRVGCFGAFR